MNPIKLLLLKVGKFCEARIVAARTHIECDCGHDGDDDDDDDFSRLVLWLRTEPSILQAPDFQ